MCVYVYIYTYYIMYTHTHVSACPIYCYTGHQAMPRLHQQRDMQDMGRYTGKQIARLALR